MTPNATNVIRDLQHFDDALRHLEADEERPIVSGAFDLRPDGTGSSTVLKELRQAVRLAMPEDVRAGAEDLTDELAAAIEQHAGGGHEGLFVAGSLREPTRLVYPAATPPRNQLRIGERASRFEIERHRALARTPVAALWVERSRILAVLVDGDGTPTIEELEGDSHHMRGTLGRTAQHDRGGPVGSPSGGHSKSNVESSALEERDRFARDAAERVRPLVERGRIVLLQGPEGSTERVLELLEGHGGTLEEGVQHDRPPTSEELAAEARERGRRAQYDAAGRLAQRIESGALGNRVAIGAAAISKAAAAGRVESLVLEEDAVGHLGDAYDARPHPPSLEADEVEALLRATLGQAARLYFLEHGDEPDREPSPPLAALRW